MKKYFFISLFSLVFFCGVFTDAYPQQWFPLNVEDTIFPSEGIVQALYADDSILYVGGSFISGGEIELRSTGRWNGSAWDSMAQGIYTGAVMCLQKYNNKIYAGGGFIEYDHPYSNKIDCWDGMNWIGLPNHYGDVNGEVFSLTIYNNMLILGGEFHSIGGVPFNFTHIAAYNGSDYVHVGFLPDMVFALGVYNGELYAGGVFPTIKKYNGSNWQDVGGIFNDYIQDMEVDTFNNFLYVAGGFSAADDTLITDGVAMWDGFSWNRVGYGFGVGTGVICIKLYRGDLYTGMVWDTIGGIRTGYLARWDGQNWHPAGDTLKWTVWDMEVFKDTLYVGGKDYEYPTTEKGILGRWYMPPDTTCKYLQPRVFALADTFNTFLGAAWVQLYNNNAYADTWNWDFDDGGSDTVKDPFHKFEDTGTFNVTVTVTHQGCVKSASKTIIVRDVTGIVEYSKESFGFKLYPNPTNGDVTVEVSIPPGKEAELRSYSIYGSLLGSYPLQPGFNKVLIQASNWSPGAALVTLLIEGRQVVIEKVVKAGNK
jgi:hypothetical protein